jgi:3-oxoacyl-[acyl-carrier-protein] synthase-3
LFGDGAGAAVLRQGEQGILSFIQGSDGTRGDALICENRKVNNPFKKNPIELDFTAMSGQEVYKFAVRTVPKSIEEALTKADVKADEIKYFILHQANIRIIEAVAKRLEQPLQKFPTNLQECGNISAGSVPILLDFVNKEGKLQKGDKIVLAGFGAGLTWGAAVIGW